jgi:hypothetical protein
VKGAATVGPIALPTATIHVSENTIGALADGAYKGVIGGQFFRRFLTLFDVPRQCLLLLPGGSLRYQ